MYKFIRIILRLALWLYCRKIIVRDRKFSNLSGPVILASNHPNAIFDAIVLASQIKKPLHFVSRGDLTDQFLPKRLMRLLHIVPVYSIRDSAGGPIGHEMMMNSCSQILSEGGILLIFSEGITENNWKLRPLKKLTSRIFHEAGKILNDSLLILPVSINYNSYDGLNKTVWIQPNRYIHYSDLSGTFNASDLVIQCHQTLSIRMSESMLQRQTHPEWIQVMISNFTPEYFKRLKSLEDFPHGPDDLVVLEGLKKPGYWINQDSGPATKIFLLILLAAPATIGWLIHTPIYYPTKWIISRITKKGVYYDTLLFLSLLIIYPLYTLTLVIFSYFLLDFYFLSLFFLAMPLLARLTLYWKENLERTANYYRMRSSLPHWIKLFRKKWLLILLCL